MNVGTDYMSKQEAAERWGVSVRTVERLIAEMQAEHGVDKFKRIMVKGDEWGRKIRGSWKIRKNLVSRETPNSDAG